MNADRTQLAPSDGSVAGDCGLDRAGKRAAAMLPPATTQVDRTRHTPRRTVVNFWVDLTLLAIFLSLAFTVGVTQFVFPNGPVAFECRLWGGDFGAWRELQFGLFAVFALGVLLHLMLHWNWLCCVANTHLRQRPPGRDDGTRTLLGVGWLLAALHLLAAALLWAAWSSQTP